MTPARVARRWDAKRPWSESGPFRATLRPGIVAEALRPPGGRGRLLVWVNGPGLAARVERRRSGLFGDERRSRGACLRRPLRGAAEGAGRGAIRSRAAAPRAAPSPVHDRDRGQADFREGPDSGRGLRGPGHRALSRLQALPRSLLFEPRVIMVVDRTAIEGYLGR